MKTLRWILMLLLFALPMAAQVRPFVETGVTINGGGYSAFAPTGLVGVDAETKHFVSYTDLLYEFARKTNDGETSNQKGHVLSGESLALAKAGDTLFGVGASYGKTITTDYTKESLYPALLVGRDFKVTRFLVGYEKQVNEITHYPTVVQFTPGPGQAAFSQSCHCTSDVNAIRFDLWYPRLDTRHHLFFHASGDFDWFHATLTDPYNLALTAAQKSQRNYGGAARYGILWRF